MSKRPSTPRPLASVGEGSTRLQLMCKIPGFQTRRWGLVQAASPKLAQLCEQGPEIQVYIAGSCWELLGLGIRLHACVIFAGGIVGWEVCHGCSDSFLHTFLSSWESVCILRNLLSRTPQRIGHQCLRVFRSLFADVFAFEAVGEVGDRRLRGERDVVVKILAPTAGCWVFGRIEAVTGCSFMLGHLLQPRQRCLSA